MRASSRATHPRSPGTSSGRCSPTVTRERGSRSACCRSSASRRQRGSSAPSRSPRGARSSSRSPSRDPTVLVVEDLHWADLALLDFLEHLVEHASGVPLFVLATARPELADRAPGWAGGLRNATTITLNPLSETETARLVSGLLEQTLLPADLQRAIIDRAGGNPLYAEEVVRLLRDRGLLDDPAALADLPLPETVQALIASRLDTLSPERKGLLQDAAILGKVFWSGGVAAIGGASEQHVEAGLHELERREFVRPSRTSAVEGEQGARVLARTRSGRRLRTDPAAAARAEAPGRRGLDRRERRRPGRGRRRPARAPPRRGGRALRRGRGAGPSRCPPATRQARARSRRRSGRSASIRRARSPISTARSSSRRRARAPRARRTSRGRRDPGRPRAGGRGGARRGTPCSSRRFGRSPDGESADAALARLALHRKGGSPRSARRRGGRAPRAVGSFSASARCPDRARRRTDGARAQRGCDGRRESRVGPRGRARCRAPGAAARLSRGTAILPRRHGRTRGHGRGVRAPRRERRLTLRDGGALQSRACVLAPRGAEDARRVSWTRANSP